MSIALDRLAAEDFDALVGTALHVTARDTALAMTLEEVNRSPYPTARALPGFSLLLRGPAQTPLGQGMLRVEHPVHGALDLFATPLRRDAHGVRYEIVFN